MGKCLSDGSRYDSSRLAPLKEKPRDAIAWNVFLGSKIKEKGAPAAPFDPTLDPALDSPMSPGPSSSNAGALSLAQRLTCQAHGSAAAPPKTSLLGKHSREAAEEWKLLSAEERARYDEQARAESAAKRQKQAPDAVVDMNLAKRILKARCQVFDKIVAAVRTEHAPYRSANMGVTAATARKLPRCCWFRCRVLCQSRLDSMESALWHRPFRAIRQLHAVRVHPGAGSVALQRFHHQSSLFRQGSAKHRAPHAWQQGHLCACDCGLVYGALPLVPLCSLESASPVS